MLSKTYKEVIRELRTHFLRFIGIEYQEPENEHESDSDDEDSKLFFKSCTNGDLDTVKTVSCKNIDIINSYDRVKKDTDLHKAVKNNHLEVAKFLLINKADPEPYDIDTLTPIEFAVENNNPDMVKLILQYDDIDFNQCMEFCVHNRYSSIIEILACYQETGYNGLYAIKVACRLRYLDLVVLLRCFLVYNNNEDIPKMVYSIGYMVITHFDYIYDCITIETLVSLCVLCCPKIAILFKK
uniref:CNPV185 protein n=1 Tax=Avipoxvirus CVL TaxID=365620 RepID=Q2PAZ9_9POXV|nr:CNPV185 protein [Avipoxvirus CVL]